MLWPSATEGRFLGQSGLLLHQDRERRLHYHYTVSMGLCTLLSFGHSIIYLANTRRPWASFPGFRRVSAALTSPSEELERTTKRVSRQGHGEG